MATQPQVAPPSQTVDYDALARQAGAVDTNQPQPQAPQQSQAPQGQSAPAQGVDYDALAKQAGAVTPDVPADTSGITRNADGSFVITPKEGESFQDTMKRAAEVGKTVTPEMIQSQAKKGLKETPAVLAAAPVIGAAGTAALAGAGEAGAYGWEHAPEIARAVLNHAKEPGTIIKLPFGRTIEYYLMAKMGLSKGAVGQIAKHLPIE